MGRWMGMGGQATETANVGADVDEEVRFAGNGAVNVCNGRLEDLSPNLSQTAIQIESETVTQPDLIDWLLKSGSLTRAISGQFEHFAMILEKVLSLPKRFIRLALGGEDA